MSGVQVIRIDDRDPSITYSSGSWSQGGNGNEYLSTTSRTNQVGATATVNFTGTKIMIYGTIDSTALGTSPVSLFSVDGGRATQFVERQIDTGSQYQQKFYESPDLSPGAHQLVITISSVPSVRASFTFDYAEYYVSPNVASTSSSTTAPVQITTVIVQQSASSDSTKSTPTSLSQTSSTSTSQSLSATRASSSTVPVSVTMSTSPLSSHTDSSSNTSSAGTGNSQNDASTGASGVKSSSSSTPAIVGAVVGVLVLLGILLCLFFLLKRRRARKAANSLGLYQEDNAYPKFNPSPRIQAPRRNTDVTPFLPQHHNHSNGNFESNHTGGAVSDLYTPYMSEYYPSSGSASGRASSFDPSSSSSAVGASGPTYGIGAGFSKGAEARQERERIEEEEMEQPPPQYES